MIVWLAAPLKVTVAVDEVNAVTPDQLPATFMVAAPEQVRVPTVRFVSTSIVPVETVIISEFDMLSVTFKVLAPTAMVPPVTVKAPVTLVVPAANV